MSGLKEIRRRIASVKNTKQITRAMKLVSAAKLRRAQQAAIGGRSFKEHLEKINSTVVQALPENFAHPLLAKKEKVGTRRIVVIAGERGLCGAYNNNIFKEIQSQEIQKSISTEFVVIGRRAVSFANRMNWKTVVEYEGLSENALNWPAEKMCEVLVNDFILNKCDEIVIYYTKFISTLSQKVMREVLLPFGDFSTDGENRQSVLSKFDPQPEKILSYLLPLLVKTKLTQAGLEAKASEHAARMTAMDSATNNADDLISRLRLFYNRARQSTITRELIDIVGGAEAIK